METSLLFCMNSAAATVCLFSAFLLFSRAEGIRARKVLGGILLAWGIMYLVTFGRIGQITEMSERGFMPVFGLIGGVPAGASLLFYMLEVMRSGWLSWKKVLLVLSPYFLAIAIFVVLSMVSETPVRHLTDPADFINHIDEFNVWYRLVFFLITTGYIVALFAVFLRYAPRYRRWIEENYSSIEQMDISWMRNLLWGMVAICGVYFLAMGSETFIALYIYYPVMTLFFSYQAYKGLFQQNPYPEHFFHVSLLEDKEIFAEEETMHEKQNGQVSVQKKEEYRKEFEQWMEKDKPYLRTDFKLTDLQNRLPMNRTYLSRFFNEFYGCSFHNLVRRYRVEEAKQLLRNNPSLIAKEIFPLCGFASEAVFHRAFTEVTGTTPKQYRLSL